MDKSNLKEGDRVKLIAFEDQPEQMGEVVEVDHDTGVCMIEIDKSARLPDDFDGLTECTFDQIETLA
jgi:hypothetical protein